MDSESPWAAYSPALLEAVAAKLFRPRIGQPADELAEKLRDTQKNPPVIDRLLKSLPEATRRLIALVGRSRQPRWRMDDLMALAAALGETDGFATVLPLLEHGLAFAASTMPIDDFPTWFAVSAAASQVVIPDTISHRAAALPLRVQTEPVTVSVSRAGTHVDGLDWPLRLAIARQQVRIASVKLTQTGTLYKRDFARFNAEGPLQLPLENGTVPVDVGLLALAWAKAANLLHYNGELTAAPWPAAWKAGLHETRTELFAALFAIAEWDPLAGVVEPVATASATAGLLVAAMLADTPDHFQTTASLAAFLWEHHPHWNGLLPKTSQALGGVDWVEAWLAATLVPLGVVETAASDDGTAARLTSFGRNLLANAAVPPPPAAFPQTLLVQPNSEVLVYRQGLTPHLVAMLTAFAGWKQIGAACTLDLTADTLTRGLEDRHTLETVLQTLERHGMKPTPPNIADLLRRWADKRERLVVYPSATLVEFLSPQDLDAAIARGIVSVRITDRIGVTGNGAAPDFANLRLVGNRDYESRPAQCVQTEADGLTLKVDAASADLLLDAEIARFAEPLPSHNGDARRYRMSPASIRTAADQGQSLERLEEWFQARSGAGIPAAARLFLLPPRPLAGGVLTVIETATSDVADGIVQWPDTAGFVQRRLGPTALAVEPSALAALKEKLASIGLSITEAA